MSNYKTPEILMNAFRQYCPADRSIGIEVGFDWQETVNIVTAMQEEIAALKAELAKKPVCMGYIDEQDLNLLRKNDYLQYPEVSVDEGGDYKRPIYSDPPEEIAHKGEEG